MTKIRSQDQLLDAASKVFREKGYEAARLEDIAAEVGVLQGSLYYHIESKAALLRMVRVRRFKELSSLIEHIAAGPEGPGEKLRRAFLETWRYMVRNVGDPAGGFVRNPNRTPKEAREDHLLTEAYREHWKSILVQGVEEGVVRDDLNLSITVVSILGMLSWAQWWYHEGGPLSADEIAGIQYDLIWSAISQSPRRGRAASSAHRNGRAG